MLRHPLIAKRSCDFCQKFLHDEDTGYPTLGRDKQPEERAWYNVGQVETCPPMCRTEKGCPKGTPDNQRTLHEINKRAYEHYLECKAVGQFPDDPLVRQNARIIREAEDDFARYHDNKRHNDLVQLLVTAR